MWILHTLSPPAKHIVFAIWAFIHEVGAKQIFWFWKGEADLIWPPKMLCWAFIEKKWEAIVMEIISRAASLPVILGNLPELKLISGLQRSVPPETMDSSEGTLPRSLPTSSNIPKSPETPQPGTGNPINPLEKPIVPNSLRDVVYILKQIHFKIWSIDHGYPFKSFRNVHRLL